MGNLKKIKPKKITLSVCMIVKNESKRIKASIESIKAFADEVIVSDTGSTDDTVKLARETGATVYEHEPLLFMTEAEDGINRIHFSANRNRVASYAKGEWVLSLDGDEVVTQCPPDLKKRLKRLSKKGVEHITVKNVSRSTDKNTQAVGSSVRIYRNSPHIKWERPVHNALHGLERGKGHGMPELEITSYYDDRTLSDEKGSRSAPMLEKVFRLDNKATWAAHYLGIEYAAKNQFDKAMQWAKIVLQRAPKDPAYCRSWFVMLHCVLRRDGLDVAEKMLYQALTYHPDYPDLHLFRVIYALARLDIVRHSQEGLAYSQFAPQVSHTLDYDQVACGLQIPWPYVQVEQQKAA